MAYDPTIFNIDPYYDDYDSTKKFIRMLFRPGYAVQARELTQIQSILHNQIQRFGDNIFYDGSIVLGGEVVENKVKYARISGLTGTLDLQNTIGTLLTANGYANARIVHAESGLSASTIDNFPVIFFEYTSGGTAFSSDLTVGGTASDGSSISMQLSGITSGSITGNALGNAVVVSVGEGVRYVDGFFVANDKQTIGAYSLTGTTGTQIRQYDLANSRIGFDVNRQFVSSEEEETLKDPAFGYYNYSAPGADRYKIDLNLTQYQFAPTNSSSTENFSRENFIEFIRIVEGNVVKKEKYPDYVSIVDTMARRTYDESGNYTVEPFSINITDSVYGPTGATLSVELGAGKAYIYGYEFETQGTTKLDLPKPRTTRYYEDARLSTVVGPYVLGEISPYRFTANGLSAFDLASCPKIFLSSVTGSAPFSEIGNANIRGIQYVGGTEGKRWRIDLFDISMTGSNVFSNVRSIFVAGLTSASLTGQQLFSVYSPTGGTELLDYTNTLLFPHTAGNGTQSISDVNYLIRMSKVVKFDATGSNTISISNLNLGADSNKAFFNYPSGVYSPASNFSVINLSGQSVTNAYAYGNSVDSYGQLFISSGPTGVSGIVNFEVSMQGQGGTYLYRPKTLTSTTITVTGGSEIKFEVGTSGLGSLGKEFLYLNKYVDVVSVSSITGVSGDITNYFTLDTGQRDNYYDWSKIVVAPGYTSGNIPGKLAGTLTVSMQHFARPTSGVLAAPFTVDSYSLPLEQIPTYTSSDTGKSVKLSDVVDFRSDKLSDGTFYPNIIPSNNSINFISLSRYLPRTDKIVLTRNKEFKLVQGVSDVSAPTPKDEPNNMTLYTLFNPAYTYSKNDVAVRVQNNKRYTMEDIGNLEKRIGAVEYYTSLSLLEQEAKNTVIEDDNGIDVPKKGILVDSFRGHNISDVIDKMFNASIDYQNNFLRPAFRSKIYRMDVDSRFPSSSYVTPAQPAPGITADRIYTIQYTETPGVVQPLATTSRKVNPYGIFDYLGNMKLYPESDFWFSDTETPTVRVNISGENDNWSYSVRGTVGAEGGSGPGNYYGFGTQWNDWESNWFGKSNLDETNQLLPNKTIGDMSIQSNYDKSSSINNLTSQTPESITQSKSSNLVNKDLDYYARNIYVLVQAEGLKPYTKVYAFVDGNTTPSLIYEVIQGATAGAYSIVSSTNNIVVDEDGGVGKSDTKYAILLNETGNVKVGARLIRLSDSSTNDLSQTTTCSEKLFYAEGSYGSKENDIVSTRKTSSFRESVNSSNIETEIFTKKTGSAASTRSKVSPLSQSFFVDPTLYPYGFFIKSINVWFATKDSNSGVPITLMLKPISDGYPHPSKVMPLGTATLYSRDITTSTYATGTGTNFSFTSPIYLVPGFEYSFSFKTSSQDFAIHTAVMGDTVYRATEGDPSYTATNQPNVGNMFAAQGQNTLTKIENEDLKFTVNVCVFDTANAPVLRITNIPNNYYGTENTNPSVVRFHIPNMNPPGTSINMVEEGIFGNSGVTKILESKNIIRRNSISSDSTGLDPTTQFTSVYAYMITTNKYVSPVIDLDRACIVFVENQINNNNVGSSNDNGEETPDNRLVDASARSKSRYITKKVNLEYPATRLDVYLTMSNPSPSSIEVFARTLPDETDSSIFFSSRGYSKMAASTTANTAEGEYQETKYTLTVDDKDKFSTFAIKIVFNSSIESVVPTIKSLRVIAT